MIPSASVRPKGHRVRSPLPVAPEQFEGRPADARSDVFAIGVVLYEMLSGRRPFTGDTTWSTMAATVTAQPDPIQQLRPDTPPALARIVTKCLEKRPDDRYRSATEVSAELDVLKGDLRPVAAVPAPRSALPRLLVAGAVAVALLAVGAAV